MQGYYATSVAANTYYTIMDESKDSIAIDVDPTSDTALYRTLNIYIDGSCSKNGKIGSIAGVGVWIEEYPDRSISKLIDPHYNQTNQVAELLALKEALKVAANTRNVTIHSDSKYVINTFTEWYEKWKNNNWKKGDGRVPQNLDIIKDIMEDILTLRSRGRIIDIVHVKAHSNIHGNEQANTLAVNATKSTDIIEQYEQLAISSTKDRLDRCIDELMSIRNSL